MEIRSIRTLGVPVLKLGGGTKKKRLKPSWETREGEGGTDDRPTQRLEEKTA